MIVGVIVAEGAIINGAVALLGEDVDVANPFDLASHAESANPADAAPASFRKSRREK